GCVAPEDEPSLVHDLRVLGMAFEPPELMAPSCVELLALNNNEIPPTFEASQQMRALIADPAGGGRSIDYDLAACTDLADLTCTEDASQRVELGQGSLQAGGWSTAGTPGPMVLPGGTTPLLKGVLDKDQYHGLGGIRLPVVLHLKAGDEEVYATKLMVFSCQIYPDYPPNVPPHLPGLRIADTPWPVDPPPAVQGRDDVLL